MTRTIQFSYSLTLKHQIEGHIKIFSSHAFFPHLKVSRRIKSHVLDRLVFIYKFFFRGLGGWLGVQKDCQNLWQIGSESCDMKIRIVRLCEADTLPSHPSFSSSLPLFSAPFFLSCQIWHPVGRFLQTKWTKPANQQLQSCRYFTLLTYLLNFFAHRASDKTGLAVMYVCVCVCVFFFLCFWVCLSLFLITSVKECATWWLFFCFLGFLFSFFHKTNHLLTTNSQGITTIPIYCQQFLKHWVHFCSVVGGHILHEVSFFPVWRFPTDLCDTLQIPFRYPADLCDTLQIPYRYPTDTVLGMMKKYTNWK
jgi:hypothetical protein